MKSLRSLFLRSMRARRIGLDAVLVGMLASVLLPVADAQVLTLTNSTASPIPGAGHGYIYLLNETVNPANGSVSVNISLPMPKGRGIHLPVSINYDSGQVVITSPTVTQIQEYDVATNFAGVMWLNNVDLLSSSGWVYGLPFANWTYGQILHRDLRTRMEQIAFVRTQQGMFSGTWRGGLTL